MDSQFSFAKECIHTCLEHTMLYIGIRKLIFFHTPHKYVVFSVEMDEYVYSHETICMRMLFSKGIDFGNVCNI